MKKVLIRNGVFETNSSSAHSVSLAESDKDFVLDTIYPDENGKIILTGGEFGWEWFKSNDALTKANYAAVAHMNNPDLVIDLIKEQTGADEVIFDFSGGYDDKNWSYIDHDSQGVCPDDREKLRNFIFNKNSWLFGGNDNGTAVPNFYDVPIFKEDGTFIIPQYKYKLSIANYDKTAMFLTFPDKETLDKVLSGLFDNGTFIDRDMCIIETNTWSSLDDYFEYSAWKKEPNLEKREIYFVHRNSDRIARSIFKTMYAKEFNFETDYPKLKEIETDLFDNFDPRVVITLKFSIDEIQ